MKVLDMPAEKEPKFACTVDGASQGKQGPAGSVTCLLPQQGSLPLQEELPHYQKMCHGLYLAYKKLKYYFQEFPLTMVSTTLLGEIFDNKDATGRVAKWARDLAT